jgi:homoserine kinase
VEAGAFGATLSGSGSAIVAVAPIGFASRIGSAMQKRWSEMSKAAEVIVGTKPVAGATSSLTSIENA